MPLSYLPAFLTSAFVALAQWLDRRSAVRLPLLLCGLLLARGRRTVTAWFRAAGISDDFRPHYTTVCAVGRKVNQGALSVLHTVAPLLAMSTLPLAKLPICRSPRVFQPEPLPASVTVIPKG